MVFYLAMHLYDDGSHGPPLAFGNTARTAVRYFWGMAPSSSHWLKRAVGSGTSIVVVLRSFVDSCICFPTFEQIRGLSFATAPCTCGSIQLRAFDQKKAVLRTTSA